MNINKEDILKYLRFLNHKTQIEIRAIRPPWFDGEKIPVSTFMDNPEKVIEEVEKLNGKYNIYVGINERKLNGRNDNDVEFITNIGHDIDAHGNEPERLEVAKNVALKIKDACIQLGYKEPLILNSGRGFWVIHHVSPIPNTEENAKKIKEFGMRIKKTHETNPIDIDSAIYNPSRVARVPGTLNISEKDNPIMSLIINNPSGEEDTKLKDDILNIELPTYKPNPLASTTPSICSFMDYCLTHEIPKGERHKVISRNMAIYISNHPDRELLKQQYTKIQKGSEGELDNWLKGIDEKGKNNFPFSIGELVNFTKKYKIPFDWRYTPEYKQWKQFEKSEKLLEKAIRVETKVEELDSELNNSTNNQIKLKVLEYMEDDLIGYATEILVEEIKKKIRVYTWRDDNVPEMWIYIKGKYTNNGETIIKEYLRKILGEEYSSFFINKVLEKLKADTYVNPEEFINECLKHDKEINVKNGIITINPITYQIELKPHTPDKKFLNQLNIEYNPNAICPNIDKFLEETLAAEDDRNTAYEVIGVALDTSLITKKAVITYGQKDTGKSTFLNMLLEFLGKDNCCNLTLHQLTEDKFSICNLFGKIANISADLSSEEVKNIGVFKNLTGGDTQEGDRKFKNHIKFRNLAKFFFGCNELPRIYNADEAFWGRLIAFNFVRRFIDKKEYDTKSEEEKKNFGIMNYDVLKIMTTQEELSGLLNKALEGLIRYYKTEKFSYSRGVKEIMEHWIRQSDSFMAFCMDNIVAGDINDDYILKRDLAKRYHIYCKKHKVRSVSEKAIKTTLNANYGVFTESDTRRYITSGNLNVQERIWEGIKFKEDLQDKKENTHKTQTLRF